MAYHDLFKPNSKSELNYEKRGLFINRILVM